MEKPREAKVLLACTISGSSFEVASSTSSQEKKVTCSAVGKVTLEDARKSAACSVQQSISPSESRDARQVSCQFVMRCRPAQTTVLGMVGAAREQVKMQSQEGCRVLVRLPVGGPLAWARIEGEI